LTREKKAVGGLEKKGIGAKTLCHTRICIIKFEIEPNFEKKTVLFLFASSKKSEKKVEFLAPPLALVRPTHHTIIYPNPTHL
jgi:hypothetical protein